MRRHVRLLLLTAACLLALTACDKAKPPTPSAGSDAPAASGSTQPPADPPATPADLSKAEARRLLAEDIDTAAYMILDASTKTTVDGEDYYVFIVASREDNKPVGQVAVRLDTGEKFNYEGEGVLSDYAEFSLFDPEAAAAYSWEGQFSDGSRTLELLPMDETSFEYTLGDLTGVAQISGNTAKDAENDVTLSFDDAGALTLTGAAEGKFTPKSSKNPA